MSGEVYIGIPAGEPLRYQAYRSVNGIYRAWMGPKFETPPEARAYARTLRELPDVDPIRSAGQRSPVTDLPPSRGDADRSPAEPIGQ